MMQNDIGSIDFHYMTGGGNFTGSWMFKTITMTSQYARTFNSYDAPEIQTVDGVTGGGPGSYFNGTSIYDEFFVLINRATSEGVWLAFDYNGHWYADVGNYGTKINLSGYVSMTDYSVPNNSFITGPKSTMGVFTGDIDDMGNTINDYVYRYQWDYYNENYHDGGAWQWRRNPQDPNAFEAINYSKYIGGKLIHIDDNWYDKKGDWNEGSSTDDLSSLSTYMGKSGMRLKLWMPPWHADPGSAILKSNPEYACSGVGVQFYGYPLNLANNSLKSCILNMLNSKQSEFGTYIQRVDGMPACTINGSDNDMLQQSNNYFDILKSFRDNNPNAALDGCASGGETAMMEAVRYSDSMQITDGKGMHYTGYYTCLNKPISKIGASFGVDLLSMTRTKMHRA